MSTLPLFPSFCSSSVHLFSLLSRHVFSFLSLFAIFIFLFFLVLDRLFSFLFLFCSFHKNHDCFLLFPKNTILFVSFLVGHVLHLFFLLCIVFLYLEKCLLVFVLTLPFCFSSFKHSVSHLLLSCFDETEKCCVFSHKLEKTSSVFSSFCNFSFLLFLCSRFLCKSVWLILLFSNSFWNSLLILFLSSLFITKKSAEKPSFFVSVQPLLCVTFFLSTFFLIFYHHFFFVHFFLSSFCSSLFAFLSFFFSLISPFFPYFSISMFPQLFLHRRCCVFSFCCNSFFFCLSLLILISLFSCFFSRFFPSLFFHQKKNQNFLWSIFWRLNYVFIFWTLPLSVLNLVCFSSLRRHVSLFVLCFLFLRFFIVTFLDHRYFFDFLLSIFFWAFFKNLFVFQTKDQKYHSSFCSRFEKNPCYSFSWKSVFCNTFVFFMRDLENILSFLCFQSLFLWNYFVSLCFCPKEKWLILFTFSLHSSSSSWFVLSSCVLSLCLLSLLLLFQLIKICFFKKNLCFTILLRTIFPKNDKNIVSSFRKDLPFLLFSILFHTRKAFFCKQTCFISFFALYLSLSKKIPAKNPNRRAIWDSKRQIDVVTF